jgi:hypothetical protein
MSNSSYLTREQDLKELDKLSSVQKQLALLVQKALLNKADILIPDILGMAAEYERILVDMEEEWDREVERKVDRIDFLENELVEVRGELEMRLGRVVR